MIALIIICMLIAAVYLNCYLSKKWLRIKHLNIVIENLPKGLAGLKILHISDVHNADDTKVTVDFWEDILALDYDLAVITGDMTVSFFEQILPLYHSIEQLSEKVPVFFTDGNHEKSMFDEVKTFMESAGAIVLDNKKYTLAYGSEQFSIIGLRDLTYLNKHGYTAFEALFQGDENFKLVLQHQPQLFDRIKYYEHVFMLSGHTHGGQVRLPLMPTLYAPGQGILPKYGNGLYQFNHNYLYISKGIGTTTFPIRFFNRPEIAIIQLS